MALRPLSCDSQGLIALAIAGLAYAIQVVGLQRVAASQPALGAWCHGSKRSRTACEDTPSISSSRHAVAALALTLSSADTAVFEASHVPSPVVEFS